MSAAASAPKKEKWAGATAIAGGRDAKYTPTYEEVVAAPQRIVMASGGLQKRGKSTFGFSLPKPLAYFQLDANYEHALAKARVKYGKKKDAIRHLKYFADPRGDIKAANQEVFERLIRDFDYCVDNYRSIFIDTSSELMDVRKIAEFGRNTQIQQIFYGSIYADFRWMVKRALDSNCNVLFAHRLKEEWLAGDRTGGYVMEGWKGVQYDSQVYIEHLRDAEGNFTTNIIECAQDALLMGQTLTSEDDNNDFTGLATRVFPETNEEDWL